MPDPPKPPEVWLPLSIDLRGEAAPAVPVAAAPAAQPEVGEEVTAYCPSPRCRSDRTHTIISTYEDEIRRVQCTTCGEVHAYRKPRGEAPQAERDQRSWDEAIAPHTEEQRSASPQYTIRGVYEVGNLVQHPVFGVGIVVEVLSDFKVEILFRDRSCILVHRR